MDDTLTRRHLSPVEAAKLAPTEAVELSIARQRARQRAEYLHMLECMDGVQELELGAPDVDTDRPDDLVPGMLGGGTPAAIGATAKSHKSTLAIDLAVCLVAREPTEVLGYFAAADSSLPVVYLDYEGTVSECRDRIRRIAAVRGVQPDPGRLHIIRGLGPLDADAGLQRLDRILSKIGWGVCIVDCLYAALPHTDFSRLNGAGGILAEITHTCREADVTPIYVHHFRGGRYEGLQSLSGCGLEQHVGQWMLLDRIGRYDAETGHSRYRLEIGSRAGYGGRYTLDVTEGRLGDPGGRRWETTVQPYTPRAVADDGPAVRNADDGKLVDAVLSAIGDKPVTKGWLRKATKRSGGAVALAVEQLLDAGKIMSVEAKVRGNVTTAYRLPTVDERRINPPSSPA